jgi:hypothetical protein
MSGCITFFEMSNFKLTSKNLILQIRDSGWPIATLSERQDEKMGDYHEFQPWKRKFSGRTASRIYRCVASDGAKFRRERSTARSELKRSWSSCST